MGAFLLRRNQRTVTAFSPFQNNPGYYGIDINRLVYSLVSLLNFMSGLCRRVFFAITTIGYEGVVRKWLGWLVPKIFVVSGRFSQIN